MFGRFRINREEELRIDKERLNNMSEKELFCRDDFRIKKDRS